MQYYKDLLKENKRSKFRVFIGLSFLVVAVVWITIKQTENEPIKMFDWIYSGIFALNALVHTIGGLGYPIEGLFGKAFIKVDDNIIEFKFGVFEKEKTVDWENIRAIDYKANQLLIAKNDDSHLTIALSKLEYSMVQEIKNILTALANKKGVKVDV